MTLADNPLLAGANAALFGALSRVRGRRIFHPFGVGFEATLIPLGVVPVGAEVFDQATPRPATVRLSRSIGLPESLADPCGSHSAYPTPTVAAAIRTSSW